MMLQTVIASGILTLALAAAADQARSQVSNGEKTMDNKITITIGSEAFDGTLLNNATAAAFKELLPLSVAITELNGNEKFARLPVSVPTDASTPPTIERGDLMMYGSSTLVLFYKSFRTTYPYTNIGRLDDPAGLEPVLGSGNVDVTFEVKDQRKQYGQR